MGYRGGADAAWTIAVLHRFSEGFGIVRRFRGGLPASLYKSERTEKTRRVGNGDAVDVVGAQALRPYRGTPLRWGSSRASRHKIVSEDAVRRAFAANGEDEGVAWLRRHLDYCTSPLLAEPWILDIDTTVKPLYGRQEGAAVGYNPKKPGRTSHSYHTYSMAGTRLVSDVDVVAGNAHTSKHFARGLWALLDRIPRDSWPVLLRGDCGFGNEAIMREAEQRGLPYLFKLRLTANVKRMIERMSTQSTWVNAGQGWQAKESLLRLDGWSRQRRVIVLRRRVKDNLAVSSINDAAGQQQLSFIEIGAGWEMYEYSVSRHFA
jgi:Transposase DDE domain group 1